MGGQLHNTPQWIFALAEFLRKSEQSQAVLWSEPKKEISVATIGVVDLLQLRNLLQDTINSVAKRYFPAGLTAPPPGFRVQRLPNQMLLEKEGLCTTSTTLWTWRRIPWPDPATAAGLKKDEQEDWRTLAVLATACGFFAGVGFTLSQLQPALQGLSAGMYLVAILLGGWNAAKEALPKIPRLQLDIHFLMLAVAGGACWIGAFAEAALLLFLFSASNALEHFALHRTRREIHALFSLSPRHARVIDKQTGEIREVPIETVRPGDLLQIRPGDVVPTDAEVLCGETECDESSLTGESTPVQKQSGDVLVSGSINLWGALEARCLRPAEESSLQKIIRLIRVAEHSRAPSQRLTERFGPPYTYSILVLTVAMFFVWWLIFKVPPLENLQLQDGTVVKSAFYRAMTLLVVASPCALVLSIPSAILAAIASGARRGILFRGGAAIEKISEVNVVALDKTGTLTTGDLHVSTVESFPPGKERDILLAAFSLEVLSSHPIARAIVKYAKEQGLQPYNVDDFRSLTGNGLSGKLKGIDCLVGRRELLLAGPLATWAHQLPLSPPDTTEVWVLYGEILGRILLKDTIRQQSRNVLRQMRALGLRTIMLTGDRRETAVSVAAQLGIDEVRSSLTPEDKLQVVRELTHQGNKVAMIGDGVNDAPCLAAAYVSVTMGARGSDVALEQSEVVLMHDRIENFLTAYHLSRRTRTIIAQNLFLSLGTILLMVSASLLGAVPISVGVLAHEGSTIIVCLNSLRLLQTSCEKQSKTSWAIFPRKKSAEGNVG